MSGRGILTGDRGGDPAARREGADDLAARNGWDRAYEEYDDFDLPTYVGLPTFMKLPWVPDAAGIRARNADVAIIGAGPAGLIAALQVEK